MSKSGSKKTPAENASVLVRKAKGRRAYKIKFGDVVIIGTKPSKELVKANVEQSAEALERAARRLTKPGIALERKRDVPRFSVAEGEPGVFIRRLNGRKDRGRLVDGVFEVID